MDGGLRTREWQMSAAKLQLMLLRIHYLSHYSDCTACAYRIFKKSDISNDPMPKPFPKTERHVMMRTTFYAAELALLYQQNLHPYELLGRPKVL